MEFCDFFLVSSTSLVLIIGVLIGMAFMILMERKILGYIHNRKGPNKLGLIGILQPFGDAIKLFTKEQTFPSKSNLNMYLIMPFLNLLVVLMLWLSMPFYSVNLSFSLSVLYFFCLSSLGVYMVMLAGWASNSNYAMLGAMRAAAQTISYEVSLVLILLSFLFLISSYDIFEFKNYQEYMWFIFLLLPLSMMWFSSSLAETNRSPFDFAEGESELVSGFNVEYSGGLFAFIFLAEYSSILFMSMMCVMVFLGGNLMSFLFYMKIAFMSFMWIWVRGALPRYRYDKLMYLAWKSYLPVSLNMVMLYFSLSMASMAILTM